ncbi:MAG: helix-turn-helix domain-containing protein [Desulfovibrio sp.]|nr:helix-turn-helix domain-containing protein [Desulfovibrio sp.]
MARPKSSYLAELAKHAQSDLEVLDHHKVCEKLGAIAAVAKLPVRTVSLVLGVAGETIWRWVKAYHKEGVEGLYPKRRTYKNSKLNAEQKATVLSWVDRCTSPDGQAVHWTLERLRHAIYKKFGITLGINTTAQWTPFRNIYKRQVGSS